jgi:hypothetical protein
MTRPELTLRYDQRVNSIRDSILTRLDSVSMVWELETHCSGRIRHSLMGILWEFTLAWEVWDVQENLEKFGRFGSAWQCRKVWEI